MARGPGRIQVVNFDNFRGGLNFADDEYQLAPNETPDMSNMDISTDGGVRQRDGVSPWGGESGAGYVTTTTMVYRALWQAEGLSSTGTPSGTKYIFAFHNDGATRTIVYATSPSSGWTTLSTYPTDTSYIHAVQGKLAGVAAHYMYITNFTDAVRRWDGTTLTTMTDPAVAPSYNEVIGTPVRTRVPKAKFLTLFQGKMVAAGINENGTFHHNRLRFSHPGEYEDWRATDFIDIDSGRKGDVITGIAATNDRLFVFKEHSIHAVTGTTAETIAVFSVSENIGAVHQRAIAVTDLGIFFYDGRSGLYLIEQRGSSIRYMFDKLKDLIESEEISAANNQNTSLSWNGRRLFVGVPGSGQTYPTRTFVLDMYANGGKECWMEWNLRLWHAIVTWRVSATVPTTIIATTAPANSTLKVVKVADPARADTDRFTGTTDVAITSYFKTAWYDLGQPSQEKRWRRPTFVLLNVARTTIRVETFINWDNTTIDTTFDIITDDLGATLAWYAGGSSTLDVGVWAGPSSIRYRALKGQYVGNANSVQFKLNGPLASELSRWGFTTISPRFILKRLS